MALSTIYICGAFLKLTTNTSRFSFFPRYSYCLGRSFCLWKPCGTVTESPSWFVETPSMVVFVKFGNKQKQNLAAMTFPTNENLRVELSLLQIRFYFILYYCHASWAVRRGVKKKKNSASPPPPPVSCMPSILSCILGSQHSLPQGSPVLIRVVDE